MTANDKQDPTNSEKSEQVHFIELYAGLRPDGQKVVEKVRVNPLEGGVLQLSHSPAFVMGLASGDKIKINSGEVEFEIKQRSGNLCVRVYSRTEIEALARDLVPALEKLGGKLDIENPRMMVFSIHVSCGFAAIEKILDDHIDEENESTWQYGNVYDPKDGVTPLNWWQEILKPQ